ncbi:MAG: hypothetical protein Q4P24_09790, partial [Rhodobacterales bacterium]|nr:hypothetical protein [Rhodobacterales bacterium]
MIRAKTHLLIAACGALTFTAACDGTQNMGGFGPTNKTQQGAMMGGIAGAVTGAAVSDKSGKGALIGGAGGVVQAAGRTL